ncbi:MAG: 6,7-dimethyl-8-ribityllumazine synthase [Phycisphaerales bacterium]|nr:6,7-dimethyl-8-ribityllumazine synthase [Phycisphaerales bacterium]
MSSPTVITLEPAPDEAPTAIGLVVSRYNDWITSRLREGAVEEFTRRAGDGGRLEIATVPGTFEIPAAAAAFASRTDIDAVVCLGCVIRGETDHDRYINDAVSHALTRISIDTGIPVTFGILTTNNPEQAEARAGGAMGNKGAEAMAAAFDIAATVQHIIARDI